MMKLAQRLKIQNRKLVAVWVSIVSAVLASFALGVSWQDTDAPMILENGASCESFHSGKMFICKQGEKEILVVPLTPRDHLGFPLSL